MSKGYGNLRGTCLGIPEASISTMLYPTRPVITRTRIAVCNVVQYCSTALPLAVGEASNNLHLVLQRLAAV